MTKTASSAFAIGLKSFFVRLLSKISPFCNEDVPNGRVRSSAGLVSMELARSDLRTQVGCFFRRSGREGPIIVEGSLELLSSRLVSPHVSSGQVGCKRVSGSACRASIPLVRGGTCVAHFELGPSSNVGRKGLIYPRGRVMFCISDYFPRV